MYGIITRRDTLKMLATAASAVSSSSEVDDNMILVPRGRAIVGTSEREIQMLSKKYHVHPSWLAAEMPRREVEVESFCIDRFPVTNAEYVRFCQASGYDWPFAITLEARLDSLGRLPATNVSAGDAEAYANRAGKRLPTEDEWEFAARGTRGPAYPWGNVWNPLRCNSNAKKVPNGRGISPVDAYPQGASPFGVQDLVGNVCEWTATEYTFSGTRVVKGAFWKQHEAYRFRAACRLMSQLASNRQDYIGFRCVRDVGA